MSSFKKRLKIIIKLGVFSTAVMYGINKFIESSALVRNLLNKDSGNCFKWSHGNVYYKKIGKGSPILLIHELDPFSSGYEWNELLSTLSKNNTVYVIDLPGCGRSSKLNHMTYISYFYVRLLKEFIDDVIGETTDIIATGFSVSFVTMAASIHENIIGRITLINPSDPDFISSPITWKSKVIKYLLDCPILGTFLYYIDNSKEQIEYKMTEQLFFNPFVVTNRLVHTYYESAHICKGYGKFLLSSLKGNYMNVNINRAFSSLSNPITLIFGKELQCASSIAKKYESLNDNVKCIFISKAKMLPQIETPEKLLHYITK